MHSCSIAQSALPGASPLITDLLYCFARVSNFYPYDPGDGAAVAKAAAGLHYPPERRARLVALLRAQNGDSPALARLARPDAVVIATGQQVGLFTGPAYSLYKALTAVRLAHGLSQQGLPAVAVFWLASEDHDLAEINHCWVFDRQGLPVLIEAQGLEADRRPAGALSLPGGVVEQLREALGGLPFAAEVLDLARQAYAPGIGFAAGFRALLGRLLARHELLFFDPLNPEAKQLLAPLLAHVAQHGEELAELVLERSRELEAAGYHAQVRFETYSSLLFLLEEGRRLALRREGGDYVSGGRRFSARELADCAARLSPAAVLRPVVQDWLFPTAAVVMGPAELAYWAQSQPLYGALGVSPPVGLPRASWTLVDRRAARLLDRYGLEPADFISGEQALRERMARRLAPPALQAALGQCAAEISGALEKLGRELHAFDASLERAFQTSRRKILYQVSKIERKAAREALRRDERAGRDAAWLFNQLYPHRRLQERFYSILPFLARHGLDLIERLYQAVPPDCRHHQVLVV